MSYHSVNIPTSLFPILMIFKSLCRKLHSTSRHLLDSFWRRRRLMIDSNENHNPSISEVVVAPDGKRRRDKDMNDPPPKKIKRIELGGNDTECAWKLPQSMLDYVHTFNVSCIHGKTCIEERYQRSFLTPKPSTHQSKEGSWIRFIHQGTVNVSFLKLGNHSSLKYQQPSRS